MNFAQCVRCGYVNEAAAGSCLDCGAPLGAVTFAGPAAYDPYAGGFAAVEVPDGTLPLDFPVRPFDSVGDVLAPTFQLYRQHLGTVARVVLLAVPAEAAFNYFWTSPAGDGGLTVFSWLVSQAVGAVATGALVHAVMTLLRTGETPPLTDSYAWGLRKWWRLMACLVLTKIAFKLGAMLLCLPGVLAMVVFAVALPAAAAEDLGAVEALKRSVTLTSGYRALVFITMLVVALAVYGGVWLSTHTGGLTHAGPDGRLLASVFYAAVTQLIYSFNTTLALFTYLSLRASRGEFDEPPPATPAG